MLLPLLVSLAASQPPAPVPIDQQSWIGTNDYPSQARQAFLTGVVGYTLEIDSSGRVKDCRVATSSGQAILDEATCALLKDRAHFNPALDAAGHRVAAQFNGTVRWALPAPPPIALTPLSGSPIGRPLLPVVALTRAAAPYRSIAQKMPPPLDDPAATAPPPDPRVRFGQLDNGMRYAILQNAVPSSTLSFRMRIAGGSLDERPDQSGYAHLTEHMTFRGSAAVPDGQLSQTLSQMGLSFGTDSNAFTTPEETFYILDFPTARASASATGLFLLREIASHALMAPQSLESERGVVLAERRQQDDPAHRAEDARLAFLLDGQPIGTHTPIGTSASIMGVTAPRLADFYHDHDRPDRTVLIVVGDVDPARMAADIQARFGDWQATGPAHPLPDQGGVRPRKPVARLFVEPGAPEQVQLAWVQPFDASPDDYARQRRRLVEWITTSILNDRLERAAENTATPFTGAHAQVADLFHAAQAAMLNVVPFEGRLPEAIEAAVIEQRRLTQFGVTPSELARAVALMREEVDGLAARGDSRGSPELAGLLLASFDRDTIFTTPRQTAADMQRLAGGVTVSDVKTAAQRLFAGAGPLLFVSTGKVPPGGEVALTAMLAHAEAVPVMQSMAKADGAWGYDRIGPPGRIADRTYIADLDVTVVRFANGTSLTLKPAPNIGQILCDLTFGAGLAGLPPGLDHAYWLVTGAPQAFLFGGLGKADLSEVSSQLNGKAAGVQFSASEERLHLAGQTRRDSLDAQLQLLTAYIADPAFRPQGIGRIMSAEALAMQQADSSPLRTIQRKLPFLLHDRDTRWQALPTLAQFQATKAADLRALIGPALAGPADLVIVGDVDIEAAIEAARLTIGALPPRGPRPASRDAHFPVVAAQPIVETVKVATEQGAAVAAWPIPAFFGGMADARAMQVLARIVEGRLIEGLRAKDGLTYAPLVGADQSEALPGYGAFVVQVEIPPAKAPVFYDDLAAIMRDLADKPVTPEELLRARSPLVEDGKTVMRNPGYWLHALSGAAADPRYFDTIRTRIRDLGNASAADVQRLARQYFAGHVPYRVIARSAVP